MTRIMLVGNPNCGKTTLFNALTGENQRIGNWPGVTVEKKTGFFEFESQSFQLTDLPGVYSLVSSPKFGSPDEQITAKAVVTDEVDLFINVIDACHLERHLYLTSQLLELGKPMVIALSMMDIAIQRGITIDIPALSQILGTPVVAIKAHLQQELNSLTKNLKIIPVPGKLLPLVYPQSLQNTLSRFESLMGLYAARRWLEGGVVDDSLDDDVDVLMADARYQAVHHVVLKVMKKKSDASEHLTAKIDRIVLHRFWAFPLFFGVMYMMFLFAIHVGGAFQDFFDIATDAIFVKGTAFILQRCHMPQVVIALCSNGIGKGINTTLTFIPVMAAMYFFLSLLETSGYMARAAFVVDKIMRILGLPGKSFVPMIIGFGCNVPAVMAARTLDSKRDRLLTVLMSPFMSCSARLAIYAVFVAAFFPTGGQNVVFSLYLIGILMAVLTGFMLRKTLFKGPSSPLILELPAYHRPSLRRLWKETLYRLRYFLVRASKLIIPVCVVLGGLNSIYTGNSQSILASFAQWLTPIFSPMGLHQDNWPATVGLLTGMLAKEVVVGSLNSLYAEMGHLALNQEAVVNIWTLLQQAFWTIPHNIAQLGHALIHPFALDASDMINSHSVYGIMNQHFEGKVGAFAYLLFVLLYIPCVSTMAAIRQESTRRLMWFSVAWSLFVAYAAAVLFYQVATVWVHPEQTLEWLIGLGGCLVLIVASMRYWVKRQESLYAIANT